MLDAFAFVDILGLHLKFLRNEPGGKCADLRDTDLRSVNLQSIDLRRANLISAKLSGRSLAGADLREALFIGADLSNTDLTGANLEEAFLTGADLSLANLRGANLQRTHLEEATLQGACLIGADTDKAYMLAADLRGAIWNDEDLRGAHLQDAQLDHPISSPDASDKKTSDILESSFNGLQLMLGRSIAMLSEQDERRLAKRVAEVTTKDIWEAIKVLVAYPEISTVNLDFAAKVIVELYAQHQEEARQIITRWLVSTRLEDLDRGLETVDSLEDPWFKPILEFLLSNDNESGGVGTSWRESAVENIKDTLDTLPETVTSEKPEIIV